MEHQMRTWSAIALVGLTALAGPQLRANNIQVTNAALTGNTGTTAQIQFDLTWENSWRGGGVVNWDAAWVFVKYATSMSQGTWQHVLLNNTGHVAPTGSMIETGLLTPGTAYNASTNPVLGVFVRRDADGTGSMALTGVQLQWDFGVLGLAYNDIAQIQVFAVEMVYVPQGSFAAGSGGTETSAFTLTTINTATASTAPSGTGSLGGQAGGFPTGQTAPVASWPNGFRAFYSMKYELSQQAYVEMLNALTYDQQAARVAVAPSSATGSAALGGSPATRNGIVIQTPGVANTIPAVFACNLDGDATYGEAVDGKDLACNWLSVGDLTAYMDWSCLRPMTELEYEKACRGTVIPFRNNT